MEFPVAKPPLGALAADMEGNLWVKEERGDPSANVWTVFDQSGRMLGRVRLPLGLCEPRCGEPYGGIMEIGSDYILGTHQDEFDVPFVRLYQLRKRL